MATINLIKKRKLFEKNDVFLYIALGIIIFVLFLSFVIIPTKANSVAGNSKGFIVYKDNVEMFSFDYKSSLITFNNDKYKSLVNINDDEENIYITIFTDEKQDDFNKLKIVKGNFSVSMYESTCFNKYCEKMPEIKNSGTIYCAPHRLKIVPAESDGFTPPVAG